MAAPELDELISAALEAKVATLRVALPGIVTAYDAATRTATVQPAVRRPLEDEEGEVRQETYAPIQNVPVVFPGSAALSMYFALAPGDVVELVWNDYSPALWRATGKVSDCPDIRAHGPSYPVAFPWYRPGAQAGAEADDSIGRPTGLRIHFTDETIKVGDGSDFVAMATKTDARLSALEAFAAAHTHPVAGITPGPGAVTSAPAPGAPTGPSVASTDLKAD